MKVVKQREESSEKGIVRKRRMRHQGSSEPRRKRALEYVAERI